MKSQLIAVLLCLYPLGAAYATECFIATRNDVPGDLNDMIHENKYDFRGYAHTCNYLKTFNAGIEVASATFTHDGGGIATTALNVRLFDLKLAHYWDETLVKTYDENLQLAKLAIDEKAFKKEKRNLIFSIFFISLAPLFFLVKSNSIIHIINANFYVSKGIIGAVLLSLILILSFMIIVFGILFSNLIDLRRLVK